MNKRMIAKTFAVGLLLVAAPACSTINGLFSGSPQGPNQIDNLVSSIETVYVNSELAKEKVDVAFSKLQTLTSSNFSGDAVAAYQDFVLAVEESEAHAETLAESVEPMKELAGPVFEQWARDLSSYQSTTMRQRSQARLAATRERYDAVVAAVDPAMATFELYNRSLQDHVLYLKNDLNPAALGAVQGEVQQVGKLAVELRDNFSATMVAARNYVDAAALPTTGEPVPARKDPKVLPVGGKSTVSQK